MQRNPCYNEHNPETQTANLSPLYWQMDVNRSQFEQLSIPGVLFDERHIFADASQ